MGPRPPSKVGRWGVSETDSEFTNVFSTSCRPLRLEIPGLVLRPQQPPFSISRFQSRFRSKRVTVRVYQRERRETPTGHKPLDRLGPAVVRRGLLWHLALLPNCSHKPRVPRSIRGTATKPRSLVPTANYRFLAIEAVGYTPPAFPSPI
jgi:hypothetical protein